MWYNTIPVSLLFTSSLYDEKNYHALIHVTLHWAEVTNLSTTTCFYLNITVVISWLSVVVYCWTSVAVLCILFSNSCGM